MCDTDKLTCLRAKGLTIPKPTTTPQCGGCEQEVGTRIQTGAPFLGWFFIKLII